MVYSEKLKKNLKSQYTQSDDLVNNFYKPVLKEAKLYQRVSGYFSSEGLDLYAEGIEELAKNHGEMQFVISKDISEEDYKKITEGYKLLEELRPLNIADKYARLTPDIQKQLGNLAYMIATGNARVKIALSDSGIFHDKFGLVYSDNECIFFNGSVNETKSGISKNYESISVDTSWDESINVQSRITENAKRFERLWTDTEPGVKVFEASQLTYNEIIKYQVTSGVDYIIKNPESSISDQKDVEIPLNTIVFRIYNNTIVRIDNSESKITRNDRKLKPGSDLAKLFESDNETVNESISYKDLLKIIEVTKKRALRKNIDVFVSDAVKEFIARNRYSIEQYKILGEIFKGEIRNFPPTKKEKFEEFKAIVQSEVSRPLKDLHLRAAFYEYEMARSANFSVPGSGKTAMILGVFAYLNSEYVNKNEQIDRVLVICPINAFDSWKREFKAVFGNKKQLSYIDSKSSSNFSYQLKTRWGVSNLVLINYESLPSYVDDLKRVIDNRTMLVFDEVHRIKNPTGIRAKKALEISRIPQFRYVLTGTPIPNSYTDIYNFLHILYGPEYNSFFGWEVRDLQNPKIRVIEEINQAIHPFFWRTNKKDLNVPPADKDKIISVQPSKAQSELAESIYQNEDSSLAILIRLIQASTNPSLVTSAINYNELMAYDDSSDDDLSSISRKEFEKLLEPQFDVKKNGYKNINFDVLDSPKFLKGIELVSQLVSEGKKVLVWGIFVDTLHKITEKLQSLGIKVNLVYGGTAKSERVDLIDEFRDGDIQVLVTNPQTLGESISLHQSVHDAVYFEYNFNLTFMLQSRDRIHRLGLKDTDYTRYYYLQTIGEDLTSDRPGYIDEKIYNRLKEKEEIMYGAIDDDTLKITYSENEILDAIKIIDNERKRISTHE